MDHVAIDPDIKEFVQLGGLQDGRAVLTRGDYRNFESGAAELMDVSYASAIGPYANLCDGMVDQVILAVSEAPQCFDFCRVPWLSFGEFNPARLQKVAHSVETGFPIHAKPVVGGDIEGDERFSLPPRTLLQIRIEHLFPTGRVEVGRIRYHTIQVKKDGVVLVAVNSSALGLRHESLSSFPKH